MLQNLTTCLILVINQVNFSNSMLAVSPKDQCLHAVDENGKPLTYIRGPDTWLTANETCSALGGTIRIVLGQASQSSITNT